MTPAHKRRPSENIAREQVASATVATHEFRLPFGLISKFLKSAPRCLNNTRRHGAGQRTGVETFRFWDSAQSPFEKL
jgi:hypothetical protein